MFTAIYRRKPIDFERDYRNAIHERVEKSQKKFRTEVELREMQNADYPDEVESVLVFMFANNEQEPTGIPTSEITNVNFVVDEDNCYAEIKAVINDEFMSLLLYPEDDFFAISEEYNDLTNPGMELVEYGQQKVIDFNVLCANIAEAAGVDMVEYITENPWELLPDDAEDDSGYDDFDVVIPSITTNDIPDIDDVDDELDVEPAVLPSGYGDDDTGDIDYDDIFDGGADDIDATELLETIAGISGDMNGVLPTDDFGYGVNEEYDDELDDVGGTDVISDDVFAASSDSDDDNISLDEPSEEPVDYDNEIAELSGSFNKIMDEATISDYVPEASTSSSDDAASDADDTDVVATGLDRAAIDSELADMKQLISATGTNLDINLEDIERSLVGGDDVGKSIDSYLDTVERPSDGFVRELAEKISEQNKEITQLQAALMSEQATSREATEKIARSTIVIEEQQRQIDKLMRDLRFAQQNRQKAEEYVSEAKKQVEQVLAKAKQSVETARRNMDRMQEHVDRKETERAIAVEQMRAFEAKLDAANADMEREREQLNREKEHAAKVVEDADQRVTEFTREMMEKLNEQADRARVAENENRRLSSTVDTLRSECDDLSEQLEASKRNLAEKTTSMNRLLMEKDSNYEALKQRKDEEIALQRQQLDERFDSMVISKDAVISRLTAEKDDASNALINTNAKLGAKTAALDRLQKRYSVLSNSLSSLTVSTGNAYRERDSYAVFVDEERARVEAGVENLRRVLLEKPRGLFKRKARWEALQAEFEELLEQLAAANDTVDGARAHLDYADAEQAAGRDPYFIQDLVPDELPAGDIDDGNEDIVSSDIIEDDTYMSDADNEH